MTHAQSSLGSVRVNAVAPVWSLTQKKAENLPRVSQISAYPLETSFSWMEKRPTDMCLHP